MPQRRKPNKTSPKLNQHARACRWGLQQLYQKPITSTLCVLVIGIALALPFLLGWAVHTTNRLHPAWEHSQHLTIYLKPATSTLQANKLSQQLQRNPHVTSTRYISPQQGLDEFKQQTGLTKALSSLVNNPLPAVIDIELSSHLPTIKVLALQRHLNQLPAVLNAKADISWLQRFQATAQLVEHVGQALGTLLSLAIILIISNVIGMIMSTHQQQTDLLQLLGASRRYTRRPLLYLGLQIGLLGALVAWACIQGILWWLMPTLQTFVQVYQIQFSHLWLDAATSNLLLTTGCLLGLISAYVASYRLLR